MLLAAILFYILYETIEDKAKRYSYAIVSWVTYMYILTEFLSMIHLVNQVGIYTGWIILDVILVIIICKVKKSKVSIKLNIKNGLCMAKNAPPIHALAGIVTFLWAIGTIPYNWDSMTYHLARVAHWAQNESVGHFATNNIRQVASPALSEFVNLHVYIIWGNNDQLLHILQWSCYITSAWLITKLAYRLGCSEKWAKISSLLFMCMPIAFAEALTTQVDLFACVWLLIFTYFILDFILSKENITYTKSNVNTCLMMGACVVYGYLTKPTVSVGMLMMTIGLLVICIKRKNPIIPLLKLLAIVTPLIVLFISPEIIRNIITFHAINPPFVGQRQLVGTVKPTYLTINFLKNFTFNFPNIYVYRSDRIVYDFVTTAARILHVELNHPSIAEDGYPFSVHEAQCFGQDTAINPVVLILSIISLCWCLYRHIKHKQKAAALTYFAFGMFCLFCVIVRWELFVSRYMLPYFALLCPIISIQFQDIYENCRIKSAGHAAISIIHFCCIIDLFAMTWYHGGIMKGGWKDEYYVNNLNVAEEYREIINDICNSDIKNVGLKLELNAYEYPLWITNKDNLYLSHINVENETAKYSNEDFVPDCIISTYGAEDKVEFGGKQYTLMENSCNNVYIWAYILEN